MLARTSISAVVSENGCCRSRRKPVGHVLGGSRRRVALLREIGHQHDELVSAVPADDVSRAPSAPKALGDCDQQLVAGLVPEAVVDDLEVVEVDVQHGDRAPGALRRGDRVVEQHAEPMTVRERRQLVVVRAMGELLLGALAVADVDDQALSECAPAVDLREDDRLVDDPADDPVRRQDPVLDAQRLARGDRGDVRLADAVAVVGVDRAEPGVRIGHPLLGRDTEQRRHLRADELGVPGLEVVQVSDRRQALDQRPVRGQRGLQLAVEGGVLARERLRVES
jgi:hypothetical protein